MSLWLTEIGFSQPASNFSRCVPQFWQNRAAFNESKTKLTFLFKIDAPFAMGNAKARRDWTIPFKCRDPRLKGMFPALVREVGRSVPEVDDGLCVEAGSECPFDDMVKFIEYTTRTGSGHKFIAGAYLIFTNHRLTKYTKTSQPFLVDSIVLLYKSNEKQNPWLDSLKRLFSPFQWDAWLVVLAFVIAFLLCLTLFVYRFVPKEKPFEKKLTWLYKQMKQPTSTRISLSLFVLAVGYTVFLALLILLYEVAVAIAVFRQPPPLITDLGQLWSLGVNEIAVLAGAASETILERIASSTETKSTWSKSPRLKEMIDWLLKGKDGKGKTVKYIFDFRSNLKYQLDIRSLCDGVNAIELKKEMIGGWIYSSSIHPDVRFKIDKVLNQMFSERWALHDLRRHGQCDFSSGPEVDAIGHQVLFLLFLFTVVPFILLFLWSLSFSKPKPEEPKPAASDSADYSTITTEFVSNGGSEDSIKE